MSDFVLTKVAQPVTMADIKAYPNVLLDPVILKRSPTMVLNNDLPVSACRLFIERQGNHTLGSAQKTGIVIPEGYNEVLLEGCDVEDPSYTAVCVYNGKIIIRDANGQHVMSVHFESFEKFGLDIVITWEWKNYNRPDGRVAIGHVNISNIRFFYALVREWKR